MKTISTLFALSIGLLGSFSTFAKDNDHKDHDKDKKHKEHEQHDDHKGHDADGNLKAPNGGRLILSIKPHAEFFVTADRKVQITFLDDHGHVVAPAAQKISVICGDRSKPTRLKFALVKGKLLSTSALPAGNDFPTILNIKVDAKAKTVREKFNLNMTQCPTCVNKEYGCTCDHGHSDHEGHDHGKKK